MKITYTAPNRSHHYPFAEAIFRAGHLHAFVSGFSRFSPRSPLPSVGTKLKRHDFFQNLYLGGLRFKAPFSFTSKLNRLSDLRLDEASYRWAKESDVFIYYRTQGRNTTLRLNKEKAGTLCVMEEVNSHVENMTELLRIEYEQIGLGKYKNDISDFDLRLKGYEEADAILCPSEFVKDSFIAKGFSPEKIIKVNYGFPPVGVCGEGTIKDGDKGGFRMLYVGQLHYRKGLRYAIEAFRRLKHPRKEFIIVGPKTSQTGLENTPIPAGVIFFGILKGEALKNQYNNASVFVLPSIEDGFGLVAGEALAAGLPLIITSNTGAKDIMRDGVEGYIVPPFDSGVLTDRLQQMADEKGLLAAMSSNAFETAQLLGSWDLAANRLVDQLSEKLNSHKWIDLNESA